jgi:hypothetical protein
LSDLGVSFYSTKGGFMPTDKDVEDAERAARIAEARAREEKANLEAREAIDKQRGQEKPDPSPDPGGNE